MRLIHAGSASCEDEQGCQMKMDYYITVKEIGLEAFGIESYGIRIEQERNGVKSAAQIDDISAFEIGMLSSGNEIDLMVCLMQKGTVTPVALEDMVKEMV